MRHAILFLGAPSLSSHFRTATPRTTATGLRQPPTRSKDGGLTYTLRTPSRVTHWYPHWLEDPHAYQLRPMGKQIDIDEARLLQCLE